MCVNWCYCFLKRCKNLLKFVFKVIKNNDSLIGFIDKIVLPFKTLHILLFYLDFSRADLRTS